MAQWKLNPRKQVRGENGFKGGINVGAAPLELKDYESTLEFGFDTDLYPALSTRKGRTAYGNTGVQQTNLLTNYGNTHLLRAVGTGMDYNSSGVVWTVIAGVFADTDWDSTNFNARLIMTNGTDEVKSWNGSALSNLNAGVAPKGKYITNDTNRVWIALGDTLYWSKYLDETNWTAVEDAGSVEYYTPNGGDITAIRRFYDRITVFKKDSMAEIQGKDYYNYALVEISNDVGCVSFKTLQEVDDTLFWLGQGEVYMYGGGKPKMIGQPIRQYLNDINPTYISKCCAWTDGLRYYLNLVTTGYTEPNVRLGYDPRYGIWRVNALNEQYRYGAILNNVTYVGDDGGQVYTVNVGTDDDGVAIPWGWVSRPFDENFKEAQKEYYEAHIQAYLPEGSTMTLSVSTAERGGSFTLIDTLTTDSAEQSTNHIIPMDTVPFTNWIRFYLAGSGYVEINALQRYSIILPVQV